MHHAIIKNTTQQDWWAGTFPPKKYSPVQPQWHIRIPHGDRARIERKKFTTLLNLHKSLRISTTSFEIIGKNYFQNIFQEFFPQIRLCPNFMFSPINLAQICTPMNVQNRTLDFSLQCQPDKHRASIDKSVHIVHYDLSINRIFPRKWRKMRFSWVNISMAFNSQINQSYL